MATDPLDPLTEIRRICLGFPETNERISHGAPCFFIRDKKSFMYFREEHHDNDRAHLVCPAPPGVQEQMVEAEPERFFRPPYVGGRGWLGVYVDVDPDWDEIAGIAEEAFRHVAPKTVVKQLDV
ncbi:MmcQ/YjbR family DNA-binding protein [Ilumatobacter nonamiensis]|uniref:MmcQ/YjbR family DNA-binding protein n=1 Tax=Ilumatobacter nonamiensis TaxID=467093 RepID=UPI00034600D3|nr:MmcQ/YjbR family DNA-binding protein [Ilumatobacter nonamiensis]